MNYEEFLSIIGNSSIEDWLYDDELGKYIYKNDLRISILSDRSDSMGDEGFYEDWATNFPNKNAYRKKYFFQYNGNTIEIFYTAEVDGYRSAIPYPKLNGMTITNFQYVVGSIINSIHGYSFDEYLQSAGITVI